jgi:hypothetical protein
MVGAKRAENRDWFRDEPIAPAMAGWKATDLRLSDMPGRNAWRDRIFEPLHLPDTDAAGCL